MGCSTSSEVQPNANPHPQKAPPRRSITLVPNVSQPKEPSTVPKTDDEIKQLAREESETSVVSSVARTPAVQLPDIVPPTTRKDQIFNLPHHAALDQRAISVPESYMYGSLKELVSYLTEDAPDDLAKLRSLFSWFTSIDVPSLQHVMARLPDPQTPLDFLLKLHWKLTNHAYFFAQLCWFADLPCYIVDGINKSAAYDVGDVIDPKSLAAQWNMVYVDKEWRLLDLFWASTCVVGRKSKDWELLDEEEDPLTENKEKTQHIFNEFYFLTDPDQLSWTHLPNEPHLQLLHHPISLEEFQDRVYLRERFFDLGLDLPEEFEQCNLTAFNGEVTLYFRIPAKRSSHYQFKYLLYKQRVYGPSDNSLDSLEDYVYYTKSKDTVTFKARFPTTGRFRLDVYGRDTTQHLTHDLVCAHVIQCAAAKKDCVPLPSVPEIGWGPGAEADNVGLQAATHNDGNIYTDDGKVQIRFNTTSALSVLQNLRNNSLDDWLLQRHAVAGMEDDQLVIDIRLPAAGEYAFNLFADQQGFEGELSNVVNYLIHCSKESGAGKPFPKLHEGILGPDFAADVLKVTADENLTSKIIMNDDGKSFMFSHPSDVELFCELHHTDHDRFTMADRVTRKTEGGNTTFDLDISGGGLFGVNIYARSQNSMRLHHVHTYLIDNNCTGLEDDDSFIDDGMELEVYEMLTSDNHLAITIPKRSNQPLQLLADLRKKCVQETQSDNQVKLQSDNKGYTFDVELPELGEYTLDVYQVTDNGAVIHKAVYLICREEKSEDGTETSRQPQDGSEDVAAPVVDQEEEERRQKEERENMLRQKLKDALKTKNEGNILAAIKQLEAADCGPQALHDLDKAKDFLIYLGLSHGLNSAMAARNLQRLEQLVTEAANKGMEKRLGLQLEMAQRIIRQLQRIEQLRHDILNLDQTTIAELKSYSSPPKPVHVVMSATFVLLGEQETALKEWKMVQVLIGKTGKQSLKRRVSELKPDKLAINVAHSAKHILSRYNVNDVRDVSAGAATFFVWSLGMIEEAQSLHEQSGVPVTK